MSDVPHPCICCKLPNQHLTPRSQKSEVRKTHFHVFPTLPAPASSPTASTPASAFVLHLTQHLEVHRPPDDQFCEAVQMVITHQAAAVAGGLALQKTRQFEFVEVKGGCAAAALGAFAPRVGGDVVDVGVELDERVAPRAAQLPVGLRVQVEDEGSPAGLAGLRTHPGARHQAVVHGALLATRMQTGVAAHLVEDGFVRVVSPPLLLALFPLRGVLTPRQRGGHCTLISAHTHPRTHSCCYCC
jgi:hypothetical protein